VPASDAFLRKELLPEAEKALGLKVNLETINGNDVQARITAGIQTSGEPDVINVFNNWAQLYAESVADVSDVASEIGNAQGGFYDLSTTQAKGEKGRLAVPWCVLGVLISYRKSWFEEVGFAHFPQSWEQYREAGKKLKAMGRPIGQTLGHTYGDAPAFSYPYLWSWGGKEVEQDGRTVALDTKETVESVKFMQAFWKDAHDEGGLGWDDSNNNRAFLSGTICATSNAASIYIASLRKADPYKTEKATQLKDDIQHAPYPAGPAGQATFHIAQSHMVMGYSRKQKAAKDLLRWVGSRAVYEKWFLTQKGFSVGATREWSNHATWMTILSCCHSRMWSTPAVRRVGRGRPAARQQRSSRSM